MFPPLCLSTVFNETSTYLVSKFNYYLVYQCVLFDIRTLVSTYTKESLKFIRLIEVIFYFCTSQGTGVVLTNRSTSYRVL